MCTKNKQCIYSGITMKKLLSVLIAVALIAAVLSPVCASAAGGAFPRGLALNTNANPSSGDVAVVAIATLGCVVLASVVALKKTK